jgi:hypothetical protein
MPQVGSPVGSGASEYTKWQLALTQSVQERGHVESSVDCIASLGMGQLEREHLVRRQAGTGALQADPRRSVFPQVSGQFRRHG